MKIVSKIHQKSIKNQWKWGPWGGPGATWGYLGSCWLKVIGFGVILSPIWRVLGASWLQVGGSWAVLGSKLGLKMNQNRFQERCESLSIRWSIWRLIFEAIWSEFGFILGSKKPPKMEPSWVQNRSKFGVDLRAVFERISEPFFVQLCMQHNIAEGTNVL